ncbi:MAG TPA: methyltransferase domain-containing protein [Patescibacteria group bacterium]|nr:methyltransferase domain-containing protein [Patescibacteria group bacterium]
MGDKRLLDQQSSPSEPSATIVPPPLDEDDLLWRQLKTLPAFRALLRSVEARFYQQLTLSGPILDVGCGDGHFAQMAFDSQITAGIDPWQGPLNKANDNHVYEYPIQGSGDSMPFPDGYFSNAISNSVLEHIPTIQPVLGEINRVLNEDGRLVITVPNDQFTAKLGGALFLERLCMKKLAGYYRRFFNKISRHVHTDSSEVWATRLSKSGFVVERWQNYFSVEALHALEWGHIQGLPSAFLHFLTGHWILAPWKSSLRITEQWLRPYYEEVAPDNGVYTLIVARKVSTNPVSAIMPLARALTYQDPISIQAIERPRAYAELPLDQNEGEEHVPGALAGSADDRSSAKVSWTESPSVTLILLLACLAGIFIGQTMLRNSDSFQSAVLPWFGLSLVALILLITQSKRHLSDVPVPSRETQIWRVSQKQWLLLLALIFVIIADRLTTNARTPQATALGLLVWLGAIALSFYCLWDGKLEHVHPRALFISGPRWEPFVVLLLFLVPLALRMGALSTHPYILSGSEASLGLDAAAVISGQLRDPFAAGWLSNPTLPAFLMALPVKLLGQTTLGVRILSPIIGSLTVVATYYVGRMFWGPLSGLLAALLLAGSHVHIHYSRIGLTNIWDPFILVMTIGLVYLAWTSKQRFIWLIAGLFVGFSAYFYTTSHLMPAILLGAALYMFSRGSELTENRRHIATAAFLAIIVALPQLFYYQANPEVFFDRYRTLGILQGNWLVQEMARSGENAAGILTKQFAQGILAFNFGIDRSNSYTPGIPILSFVSSVLLLLGLGLALVKIASFKNALLILVFFATTVIAGVLLIDPPSSHRLLIALPVICLLIASALLWLAEKFVETTHISSRFVAPTLIAIVLLLAIIDVSFYFGRYRVEAIYGDRNTEVAYRISNYLNNLDGQWDGYFFGPPSMFINFPTFAFLIDGWQSEINLADVAEEADLPQTNLGHNTVLLFLPERANEIEQMDQLYHDTRLLTFSGSNVDPLFYALEIPADN